MLPLANLEMRGKKLAEADIDNANDVPATIVAPPDESAVTKSRRQRLSDLFTIVSP
jgi:hypothetical protein